MTREYEAVYIFDSALEDETINERLGRFHGLLQVGDSARLDHWGRRQLAYKIRNRDTGYYVIARFAADGALLPEYERALKLDEGMLRHLLTLHEHELGAPPLTEEQIAARARGELEDDDEE
jgi:small subunit ribosomal protein S6